MSMESSPPSTTPPLSNRRIMIVDDQPSIRGVLRLALQEAGAVVSEAPDGEAAVRLTHTEAPELLLLDLAMPGMDGWQVLLQLRQSPHTATIPVVLETSAEDYATYERARNLGVAAFVSKPFRLLELIETCRRILDGARPLQGRPKSESQSPGVRVIRREGETVPGDLLEMDLRGAQVELGRPLAVGERVTLSFLRPEVPEIPAAEVRWVTPQGALFRVGLSFRS